jgi:hypothetical protein
VRIHQEVYSWQAQGRTLKDGKSLDEKRKIDKTLLRVYCLYNTALFFATGMEAHT